jgi:hypothetical protein
MTEEERFEAARHIRDAAARAAYLDRACAVYPKWFPGQIPFRPLGS